MDYLVGKLELCALDKIEVVEVVNDKWVGTGHFTRDAKPGDWCQRKREGHHGGFLQRMGTTKREYKPDGVVIARREHMGLGDYDPTPVLVLWFR